MIFFNTFTIAGLLIIGAATAEQGCTDCVPRRKINNMIRKKMEPMEIMTQQMQDTIDKMKEEMNKYEATITSLSANLRFTSDTCCSSSAPSSLPFTSPPTDPPSAPPTDPLSAPPTDLPFTPPPTSTCVDDDITLILEDIQDISEIAIHGNSMLISDFDESKVKLFKYTPTSDWTEDTETVLSLDGDSDYGHATAIDANHIVITSLGFSGFFGSPEKGQLFIYDRKFPEVAPTSFFNPGTGNGSDDKFGSSVALCGDTIVVGAPSDDTTSYDAGQVYVYRQSNGVWEFSQSIQPSDITSNDQFGYSVACDQPSSASALLVVGAKDGPNTGGAVYIYQMNMSNEYEEIHAIKPEDLSYSASFGSSVAVSEGVIAVGAPNQAYGAVFLYEFFDSSWLEKRIDGEDRGGWTNPKFGYKVRMEGSMLAVSSVSYDVRVYDTEDWSPTLVGTMTPPGGSISSFGTALGFSGGAVISAVGSYGYGSQKLYQETICP